MNDSSAVLLPVVQFLLTGAFLALGIVAVRRASTTGPAGWWAAAAFTLLGLALPVLWVPDWFNVELPEIFEDLQLLFIFAFPYLLLRFTASFRVLPRLLEAGAALAALLVLAVVWLPGLDDALGEMAILVVIIGYWAGLSLVTATRLWRAGRNQPGVARRRMRLMASATAALTVAVFAALQLDDGSAWGELSTYLFALASAIAFGLGFSPPRSLRLSWRREEDEQLRLATTALLKNDTPEGVADEMLPPTTMIMGASGAVLTDASGKVVASHGDAPTVGTHLATDSGTFPQAVNRESVDLGSERGDLVVWTSAYTPFFGPEELGLLKSMAAIASLALERAELLAKERTRRAELESAQEESDRARQEAEAARDEADRANLAKSEFLSRMSHELRTPLNAILGFGQLLETSELADEDRDAVGHVLKAGRHLLALINDVLDLSRVEAGEMTISLEAVHGGELIGDSIALIRPIADERGVQLHAPRRCDDYVLTDRQRCRQVLLNLLSNAVKYNHDQGRVDVTCGVRDDHLRISVRDTGPGIEEARLERLFDPFERLGAETSGVEGTGLGLALTRQLIQHLGGQIGVNSSPGSGSTFWIELPLTGSPATPHETTSTTAPEPARHDGTRQLLLVEDNLANLRVVEAMLKRRPDVSVLPSTQGKLALELAYQHKPDVIVLDLHLPDIPGRDVLTRLKADPRTRDIPVIIASADATTRTIQRLKDDGALRYITKPLDLNDFLAAIDLALGDNNRETEV